MVCIVSSWPHRTPSSLGEKYTILNQSTLQPAPCTCLVPAATTEAFHLCFKVWQKECGGWEQGRKGVECKKREKQTNKQTNKRRRTDGAGQRRTLLTLEYHVPLAGLCPSRSAQFSLLYIFFCCCHFPCWEDSCHPSHILSTEKAALPCAWWLRLCPWCATLSVVPKAV